MTKTYNDIEAVTRLLEEVSLEEERETRASRSLIGAANIAPFTVLPYPVRNRISETEIFKYFLQRPLNNYVIIKLRIDYLRISVIESSFH